MEDAVLYVVRDTKGWRVVVGEQRLGTYKTANEACWAAMALAVHLRNERVWVELRMHDEGGVRQIWPPPLPAIEKAAIPLPVAHELADHMDHAIGQRETVGRSFRADSHQDMSMAG